MSSEFKRRAPPTRPEPVVAGSISLDRQEQLSVILYYYEELTV